jgi:hypothetical protein
MTSDDDKQAGSEKRPGIVGDQSERGEKATKGTNAMINWAMAKSKRAGAQETDVSRQGNRPGRLPEPRPSGGHGLLRERVDKRKRKTGRTVQFNTKVQPKFLEDFDAVMTEEAERLERNISRPYFLELLLASWQREKGNPIPPFGLSDRAMNAAKQMAARTGWDLATVIEDAMVMRARDLGILAADKEEQSKR